MELACRIPTSPHAFATTKRTEQKDLNSNDLCQHSANLNVAQIGSKTDMCAHSTQWNPQVVRVLALPPKTLNPQPSILKISILNPRISISNPNPETLNF